MVSGFLSIDIEIYLVSEHLVCDGKRPQQQSLSWYNTHGLRDTDRDVDHRLRTIMGSLGYHIRVGTMDDRLDSCCCRHLLPGLFAVSDTGAISTKSKATPTANTS